MIPMRPIQPLYMTTSGGLYYGSAKVGQIVLKDGKVVGKYLDPFADLEEVKSVEIGDSFSYISAFLRDVASQYDKKLPDGKFVANQGGDGTEGGMKYVSPREVDEQAPHDDSPPSCGQSEKTDG